MRRAFAMSMILIAGYALPLPCGAQAVSPRAANRQPSQPAAIPIGAIQPTLPGPPNIAVIELKRGADDFPMVIVRRENDQDRLVIRGGTQLMWAASTTSEHSGSVQYGEGGTTVRFDRKGAPLEPSSGDLIVGPHTEVTLAGGDDVHKGDWFTGVLDFDGSTYTLVGDVPVLGHLFESRTEEPLRFQLRKGTGFVFLSGKGRVLGEGGTPIMTLGQPGPAGPTAPLSTRQPESTRAGGEQEAGQLDGCVCSLDADARNVTLVPWNQKLEYWEQSSPETFMCSNDTVVVSGSISHTIAEIASGQPISDKVRTLQDLVKRRATVHWVRQKERRYATRIELFAMFAGESITVGPPGSRMTLECPCNPK
jgi:hypothetical protein